MSEIKKLLGKRIKEIRNKRGITQEKLAEMIDIGTPNISYIETGKNAPSIETLGKIAKALKVKPYELYMFEAHKNPKEMKTEILRAIEDNEKLLRIMYKFYQSVK